MQRFAKLAAGLSAAAENRPAGLCRIARGTDGAAEKSGSAAPESKLQPSDMAGEVRSAFKGRGIEMEEIREYTFGDDVRDIDWRVTARKKSPLYQSLCRGKGPRNLRAA